jgi:hypothetical protein
MNQPDELVEAVAKFFAMWPFIEDVDEDYSEAARSFLTMLESKGVVRTDPDQTLPVKEITAAMKYGPNVVGGIVLAKGFKKVLPLIGGN